MTCGKKMSVLNSNPNVCLYISRHGIKGIESVIIRGKVRIKESGCFSAYVELSLIAEEISGRIYTQ